MIKFYQIGNTGDWEHELRPIVSIDLKASGYKLKKIVSDNGNVSFDLIK